MRVRFGPLLIYNKAKRWTVPFRNGCWQCWKGCWESETPRLHGVSCESVDWNPYSSIGFAWQCGCTILWLNPTATQWKRSYMLACSWVHNLMIANQPIFFLPWMVWQNRKQKLQNCEPIDLSRPFCGRPQGETLRTEHLVLKLIRESTTANALLITNGVFFLSKGLWSLIRLTTFPNTCFLTCLTMSFAVQLVSDFVFTPYVLRQQHGIKVTPPPETCVILMMCKKSSKFFSAAPIPTGFLSAGFPQ